MEAVNEARRKVWSNQDKEFHRQATIDVDGTIAPTDGQCKSGIGMSYTGHWSYHPLVVSVAETNEVLYLGESGGQPTSHAGAAEVLDLAIELVRGGGFQKVVAAGRHGFYADASSGPLGSGGRRVSLWGGFQPGVGWSGRRTGAQRLESAGSGKEEETAKPAAQEYPPGPGQKEWLSQSATGSGKMWPSWPIDRRPASRTIGWWWCESKLRSPKDRDGSLTRPAICFYLTNLRKESAREVVFSANRRCHQENVVEQLKNGVQAMRMPSDSLESNWAYLVIAAQAWNLKAWLGLVQSDKTMGAADSEDGVSPVPAPAGSDSLPDPAAGATSSLPAAERQRLDRNAAERSAVAQAGPLRLTRHRTKQRKSTEVQGLRSKSVRKRPKIPILASRSHSEGPPAGDHRSDAPDSRSLQSESRPQRAK